MDTLLHEGGTSPALKHEGSDSSEHSVTRRVSSEELRILLLGPKNAGKSSAGNTILGKKEFDVRITLQSAEKRSERAGTKITVVDTPGWWGNLPYEENPELFKQEIVLSVTKCPPGPHVLLLVLNVDTPFKQNQKEILCGNMRCFGEEVWRHTIVLFTRTDQHEDNVTLLLENENLQWLIEKCGNRYHELNTENWGDGSQVSELLKKIQEMVEENRGGYYQINRDTLQRVEEERRKQEKRAEERRMKNLKVKTDTTVQHPLSELRIVMLGYNGSGRSSTGNTILRKSAIDCKRSLKSKIRQGDVSGRHITVVDTPGRRRNYHSKYTPRLYKDEIVLCPSHCPPGPHVFLLVIRVDVSFTEAYRKAVDEHLALLGLSVWNHIIVVFSFGDWLRDTSIELFIESEGEALQWIIDKCGNRYHVFNNRNKDDDKQVTELCEKIEEMVTENEGRCFITDYQNTENMKNVKERRSKIAKRVKQMQDEAQKKNELRHLMSGQLFEMRIVLLGPHLSVNSSTRNTILGRKAFDTNVLEENLKENGDVSGRQLTMVYTPGFEKDYLTRRKLEEAQLNIIKSLSEESPGAHAFIFVQSVDCSFAEEEKSAIEKILEPLGERVWSHTLVLFAVGDELEEAPIELFIASEGDALQWLIEKCGNRYHVLNNKNWGDGSQVSELLEKIEEMVAGNKGQPYELDRETLERVERTVAVPIKRAKSMDKPINIGGRSLSSGVGSAHASYVSQRSQEATEESESSNRSSGVESLPEFDSALDSEKICLV